MKKINHTQKVKIEIDEPWDFDIGDGGNSILATIIGTIIGTDKQEYFVVKAEKPFFWKDKHFEYLTISERYEDEKLEDLLNKKINEITVGIGRISDDKIIQTKMSNSDVTEFEYFAIGTVSIS